MIDKHILTQRLAAIADRLARIDSTLPPTLDVFLVDRTAQEIVAFNLFLAFQDSLDLCAHLIADRGWELPQTAREHFDILARHGFLLPELARTMGGRAGLRNLIAHAYGSLDLQRLFTELPAGRDALRAFAAALAARNDV